jgi:hypothetical protein
MNEGNKEVERVAWLAGMARGATGIPLGPQIRKNLRYLRYLLFNGLPNFCYEIFGLPDRRCLGSFPAQFLDDFSKSLLITFDRQDRDFQ